ncbi:hypothetical protein C882_3106 [Caenispirillum salinarum AK4]|uniref:Polymerase nucleotidyl transferase domain-containing protein n=2 Tax=Caenispirillum TaxID=414051 RepID=K9H3A5_9PROT|nr:hypothetical protein C882_3106 [Caenispirillum salinarum AK4]
MDVVRERQVAARRARAVAAARAIAAEHAALGIETWVFGSLVSGRFGVASDLDLAVRCPHARKYAIESRAQEIAGDIPVEIAYLDELREPWTSRILSEMVDAASLR